MEDKLKVFGYRVGELLFCPKCYETVEKFIPKDSGVRFPVKALTTDDLNGYFCNQCKKVKEASQWKLNSESSPIKTPPEIKSVPPDEEKSSRRKIYLLSKRLKKEKDLTDLQDIIEDCSRRVSFVEAFFIQCPPDREPEMNEDDITGLCLVLNDIQDDLNMVVDELCEKRRKGEIIEKRPDVGGI